MKEMILSPEFIRKVRRMLGDSQIEFANRLEVGAVTVARWETGQRSCKGDYATKIMELDAGLKNNTTTAGTITKQPLQRTDDHRFPDDALVFKLVCMKCGGENVHPRLAHMQADNDDYEGDVYGYDGRGEFMVIELSCEACGGDPGQLVLANHKGDGYLALYPKTRRRAKTPAVFE